MAAPYRLMFRAIALTLRAGLHSQPLMYARLVSRGFRLACLQLREAAFVISLSTFGRVPLGRSDSHRAPVAPDRPFGIHSHLTFEFLHDIPQTSMGSGILPELAN